MIERPYFIGLDVGQSQDFTAIAVVERVELQGEWDAARYSHRRMAALDLRWLERVPLQTPYPEVVERVRVVTHSEELRERCHLIVDGTGVGRAVVDMLRDAGMGCSIWPTMVTGGDRETYCDGYWRVPKRDLIVGLQVLLHRGGLRIAAGIPLGPVLVEEMTTMRVRETAAGNEQYGAWREGEHDDLVFAVALAHWGAKRVFPRVAGDDGVWRWSGG